MRSKKALLALILVTLACLLVPATGYSAVISAASTTQAAVQAAINTASSGDTVAVPAGSSTWSTGVNIPSNKKITLQGLGIGSTTITASSYAGMLVQMNQSGSRVTGFSFVNGLIHPDGTGWRIDNCDLANTSGNVNSQVIMTYSEQGAILPTGLIDHCTFENAKVVVWGIPSSDSEVGPENALWAQDMQLGDANAVYIEDCTFTCQYNSSMECCDSHHGGRVVFRHNIVNDMFIQNHSIQGVERGARSLEIYNNTFAEKNFPGVAWKPIRIRSGTGVIFNNTITGAWSDAGLGIDNERDTVSEWGSPPNQIVPIPGYAYGMTSSALAFNAAAKTITIGSGTFAIASATVLGWYPGDVIQVQGSASNDGQYTIANISSTVVTVRESLVNESPGATVHIRNPWDGIDGYPARDQPGYGKDSGLITAPTYRSGDTWYTQISMPLYEWNNTYNGTAVHWEVIEDSYNLVILQQGRDFFNSTTMPGYAPYTYPHPLIAAWSGSISQPPAPPKNLRIKQ